MTDKQIIDGIDVSGCEFYWLEKDFCNNGNLTSDCQENKDCIYKRYIRKEQECEELKEKCKKYGEINEQETKDYAELKAENDECIKDNEYLKTIIKDFTQEVVKLKATLTEIKEIAEHCIKQDICTICDNSDKCHIEDEEIPTYDVCKLILQKISECEGKDETN